MRSIFLVLFTLFLATSAFANDFITRFLKECVETERPVSNVNIGKAMLNKMASNTSDEELKTTFRELNSIRIITTENKADSKYYFEKAKEMVSSKFTDYREVVSVNERRSKINILMKKTDEKTQDLILMALDDDSKLTIITVSGNIDFNSISKISDSLRKGETEEPDLEKRNENNN
ncbi:MAG: DUF4252 domain-containing protein [Petrimonas sp.]|uniref:DUF4252 domain-containing protein n=1 Tax=Petrimonas sp. TaxID=2023866 RepID=UPI000E909E1C|nr:DUF4252 domain-containing protein [Petrimonas sp.]MEA5043770.1 DUF4252 domain-containing protein [Petrimonas sp.]HBC39038.1 hypothetical protein [Porphyromonadaceae bacterium]HBG79398.1 hypothetical protein [Porphyromonadaceae bacterium]HBK94764.1 hypothetical protein [Porphyromonadaceae bacterium]